MKNKKYICALLALAAFSLTACTGCKTSLAPEGVYAGDTLLYNAESTVVTSYAVFDTFTKWEHDNRATLDAANHEAARQIKAAADFVRSNAKTLIASTTAAIELYKQLPSEENRKSLVNALTALQAEVVKAASYIKT